MREWNTNKEDKTLYLWNIEPFIYVIIIYITLYLYNYNRTWHSCYTNMSFIFKEEQAHILNYFKVICMNVYMYLREVWKNAFPLRKWVWNQFYYLFCIFLISTMTMCWRRYLGIFFFKYPCVIWIANPLLLLIHWRHGLQKEPTSKNICS